jgi:hypothetical protein
MSPTVLLVHGAFADGSSWNGVMEQLTASGGTADNTIDPGYQQGAAAKIGAITSEIEGGSHPIAVSHPTEVADVILAAVGAVS